MSRTQQLLAEAERQKHSSGDGESSLTSASRSFSRKDDANAFFNKLRPELFCVREWNGKTTLTSFELFDEEGNVSERQTAVVGDFIRLAMIGAGKHDWVRIIEIIDQADEVILTVRPSYDPMNVEPDKKTISHFFSSDSINNFCLEKKDTVVSLYVIGLSEKTNTEETGNLLERARNVAVSNIGSYVGIQKGEWKRFCASFLRLTDQE